MATDLTLCLDDEPGELARVGDVLGDAGVDIAGMCALAARGGISVVEEREASVLDLEDRPGALAEAVHKLGVASVNSTIV